jgi:hypothetical protein
MPAIVRSVQQLSVAARFIAPVLRISTMEIGVKAVTGRLQSGMPPEVQQVEMGVSELRRLRELDGDSNKPTERSQTSDCEDRIGRQHESRIAATRVAAARIGPGCARATSSIIRNNEREE